MWLIPFGGLYWQVRSPFRWWGYFFAGWIAEQHFGALQRLSTARRRIIGIAAFTVAGTVFLYYALALPPWNRQVAVLQYFCIYGIVVGLFMLTLHSSDVPVVRWFSEATYPIYLYHFFIIAAVHRSPSASLRDAAAFVLACVGSAALVHVGRKALGRYARLLMG